MDIKNFLVNVVALATAPSLENAPVLQLSAADKKELESHLKKENIGLTKDPDGAIRFTTSGVNFIAIENDKSEDVGLDGRVIEPQKWELDKATDEEKATIEANTDTGTAPLPEDTPAAANSPIWDEHEKAAKAALKGDTAEKLEEKRAAEKSKTTGGK